MGTKEIIIGRVERKGLKLYLIQMGKYRMPLPIYIYN
jgi:hypothetical protein